MKIYPVVQESIPPFVFFQHRPNFKSSNCRQKWHGVHGRVSAMSVWQICIQNVFLHRLLVRRYFDQSRIIRWRTDNVNRRIALRLTNIELLGADSELFHLVGGTRSNESPLAL